jgi:hypothetical protein
MRVGNFGQGKGTLGAGELTDIVAVVVQELVHVFKTRVVRYLHHWLAALKHFALLKLAEVVHLRVFVLSKAFKDVAIF